VQGDTPTGLAAIGIFLTYGSVCDELVNLLLSQQSPNVAGCK